MSMQCLCTRSPEGVLARSLCKNYIRNHKKSLAKMCLQDLQTVISAHISLWGLSARPPDKIPIRDLSARSFYDISVRTLFARVIYKTLLGKIYVKDLLAISLQQISMQCLSTRSPEEASWQDPCTRSLKEVSWQDSWRDLSKKNIQRKLLWGTSR